MNRTVIFIASSFPHPISAFLAENGYNVLEARSISEADAFIHQPDVDAVIIAPRSEHLVLDDRSTDASAVDVLDELALAEAVQIVFPLVRVE